MFVISDAAPANEKGQRDSDDLQQWLEYFSFRPQSSLKI